jgi:DNA-binding CsgD family transcriptional regulator
VIVIEPAGFKEMTWLNTSTYELTPREEEVVEFVVRGASTRQISQALYVTEGTVQRHLQNVFEKVEVRSRQALVKRLYLNAILLVTVTLLLGNALGSSVNELDYERERLSLIVQRTRFTMSSTACSSSSPCWRTSERHVPKSSAWPSAASKSSSF